MKKLNHKNAETLELTKLKISSRDNKHYFYGVLLLTLAIIIFRPEYAQSLLTIIMGAGGGLGFAQLIKK
jgi:hypothetical protein